MDFGRVRDVVKGLPGPGAAGPPEPDADDYADDDKAAKVSACQEFMDAAGLKGDATEVCEAMERLLDILKPTDPKPGL